MKIGPKGPSSLDPSGALEAGERIGQQGGIRPTDLQPLTGEQGINAAPRSGIAEIAADLSSQRISLETATERLLEQVVAARSAELGVAGAEQLRVHLREILADDVTLAALLERAAGASR